MCYKIFHDDQVDQRTLCQSFREHLQTHTRGQLKRLKITRTKPVYLKCGSCEARFNDFQNATHHFNTVHASEPDGPLILNCCSICDYSTAKYPALVCHMRRHQKRKYQCELCSQKFLQKSWLDYHKSKNKCSPSKRKCDHCQKVYATVTALNLHLRKLRGEKEFVCQVCSKSFQEKRSLKEHYLTHRRERHHRCSLCPKAYVQKNHLLYHLASAHNTTPNGHISKHVCKICNKSFAFKYLLKRHEDSHVTRLVKHFKTTEATIDPTQ